MSVKKHVEETSANIFDRINQILREEGVSSEEFPMAVSKIQLKLLTNDGPAPMAEAAANLNQRRCVEFKMELRKMKDPHTGETIVQLVRVCVRFEDEA